MPYSNIDKPSKYFNTVLYTGNGTNNRTITGVGFQPDFVWIKSRSLTTWNATSDVIRGANKTLFTNATDSEYTNTAFGYTSAFTSDGFTLTTGSSGFDNVNNNGATYTSWNWKANGTGVSNTSGSITSTVSANTTSGFSIVSYTGTGANATVGHGLGAVPKMYMVKCRSTTGDWRVYTATTGNTGVLFLNDTSGTVTQANMWNSTTPTSSVFSLGTNANGNSSGATYIAYCFAEVKGFSKFGSYTGNGSADGTFVYTGFKPAFVIFKLTSGADSWVIKDNKRDSINQMSKRIFPDLSNAEDSGSGGEMDFLSNGFKFRSGSTSLNNGSGSSYIYMAFAENPFVSSKGIPACAR